MQKIVFTSILLLMSCQDNVTSDIKNTYDDDIADLTYLNGYFFTTNYDLSMDGGSQIDLFKFKITNIYEDLFGDNIYLEDSYDLSMNGQGYLAITNDGNDLYLQSRETKAIFKVSSVGERDFKKIDTIQTNWQPSGIAYNNDKDSLITLYRNLDDLNEYRMRTISKDIEHSGSDITFNLDMINTSYSGVYAIEYYNSKMYFLGVDTSGTDILLSFQNNIFNIEASIADSTIVGICQTGTGGIWGSFRDRRFENSIYKLKYYFISVIFKS